MSTEDPGVRRVTWRLADIARVFTLALLFLFAWQFFWLVHDALFLALLAVLLAMVIHAPAKLLGRWIPFWLSFVLVVVVFLGATAGLFVVLVPQIVNQFYQLAVLLPEALESASLWLREQTEFAPDGPLLERIGAQLAEFLGNVLPMAFDLLGAALGIFAIVVLAIFLAWDPGTYRTLFLQLVSPDNHARWARVYDEAGRNLRNWVIGKALTMVAVGILTWLGLTLFGIPGAVALAALAAVMELVPNFGPTIAAVPAVISAFLISPITALWVALFYFGLQQLQSAVTVPLVERRAVDIPAAVLLVWQLMLAIGFGVLALFVATPLLAVIVVAARILHFEPRRERMEWDRRESDVAAAAPDPPAAPAQPEPAHTREQVVP